MTPTGRRRTTASFARSSSAPHFAPRALRHTLGGYREYAPPASLERACEAVWVHGTPLTARVPEGATHRVLPDPAISLTFFCRRDADGRAHEPRVVVIGPKTYPQLFRYSHGWELAAVKVKLEWAAALFDFVPTDFENRSPDLRAIHPKLTDRLLDQLAQTQTVTEAADVLIAEVGARLARAGRHAPAAAASALDRVRATAGRVAVERIAGDTGISLRHLRRSVRRDAGVSLKWYARTMRLLSAVTAADRSRDPAWARVALQAGYYDQSHLVRECRALCGLTPGEIDRERRVEAETSNRA